jgi:hypothetical protein
MSEGSSLNGLTSMILQRAARAALALALLAGTSIVAGCGGSEPITATMEKPPASVSHPAPPPQE